MFSRRSINPRLATVGAGLILASFCSEPSQAYGAGYRQQAPCSCAADGTCLPKPDTWGHYTTHWRPWPGDVVVHPQAPDVVEGETTELPPLVLPEPEQEDQREPVKSKRPKTPEDEPEKDQDPDNVLEPVDDLPELPVFDPQSHHRPDLIKLPGIDRNAIPKGIDRRGASHLATLPARTPPISNHEAQTRNVGADVAVQRQGDTPPALPESLRSLTALQFSPKLFRPQQKRTDAIVSRSRNPLPATEPQQFQAMAPVDQRAGVPYTAAPSSREKPIERARWSQRSNVQLVNPAAVVTSDQPPGDYREGPFGELPMRAR